MKSIILFDLYDTVLKDISFDFNKGLNYLHDTFFKEYCSLDDIINFSETFLPLYADRKESHKEVCLIKDEIPCFFEKYGVRMPKSYNKLDYDIMNQMQEVTLLDNVKDTLSELYKREIPMYILSNSIFTGNSAMELLKHFYISGYFSRLYSSADYGIRKPDKHFFDIAINDILYKNPNSKITDIIYMGNDYETDVIGAKSVGLKTVWYNVNHLTNEKNLDIYDIDDFKNILDVVDC
jgi:putative hydrolase of the HAD superfamily